MINEIFKTISGLSDLFNKQTENFKSLPIGGTSGFGFEQQQSSYPLFLNFYPKQLGSDFNLRATIQKLKQNRNFPTGLNGNQNGNFTNSGHGQSNVGSKKCPIILMPGLGASKIFSQWDRSFTKDVKKMGTSGDFEYSTRWRCREYQETWVPLWFPDKTTGLSQYCWQDNSKVHYLDGTVVNTEGVTTIVPEFGNIDFEHKNYMSVLIDSLEALGYMKGTTLFGASYDFRKICAQEELDAYANSMYKLIERSVALNGKKAILIGHGLGAVLMNYVLVNSPQDWKDTYVQCFVSISGTFGGCPKALRVLLSGDDLPSKKEQRVLRDTSVNFTGLQLLLPSPIIYGEMPLLHYQKISYKAGDIPLVMGMAGFNEASEIYNNIVAPIQDKSLSAPGVTVYVLAGTNVPTESSYMYQTSLIDNPVKNYPYYSTDTAYESNFDYPENFNGDGTVPKFALEFPLIWSENQKQPVHFRFYERAEHLKIMSMQEPVTDLLEVVKNFNTSSV